MRVSALSAVVAAIATISFSSSVGATTVGIDECSTTKNGSTESTFTLVKSFMAQCISEANDWNTLDGTSTVLGMTGWGKYEKIDANGSGNDFNFDTNVASSGAAKSGKITADLSAFEYAFIVLKAGKGFGAFKVSPADADTWDWTSTKSISHVSIWTKGKSGGDDNEPEPVPLPAGGLLLLTGLAAVSLRKKFS